jgi:hypothetical protein
MRPIRELLLWIGHPFGWIWSLGLSIGVSPSRLPRLRPVLSHFRRRFTPPLPCGRSTTTKKQFIRCWPVDLVLTWDSTWSSSSTSGDGDTSTFRSPDALFFDSAALHPGVRVSDASTASAGELAVTDTYDVVLSGLWSLL